MGLAAEPCPQLSLEQSIHAGCARSDPVARKSSTQRRPALRSKCQLHPSSRTVGGMATTAAALVGLGVNYYCYCYCCCCTYDVQCVISGPVLFKTNCGVRCVSEQRIPVESLSFQAGSLVVTSTAVRIVLAMVTLAIIPRFYGSIL